MPTLQQINKFLYSIDIRIWVFCATALAFAFGTYRLGARNLWFDEACSVFYIQQDWSTFWLITLNYELNQVLYFLLLKFWNLFGDDESTLRFLSVIFSTAAVPMIYAVGKELFDKKAGVVAAFLLAVNGERLYYAQEVRGYSLLLLLSICSSYIAIRCIKYPSRKMWVWYVIINILAPYVHFFAVWITLVHAIILLFLPKKEVDWKSVFTSAGCIIVGLSPILIFILNKDAGQIGWLSTPNLDSFITLLNKLTGLHPTNNGNPLATVMISRAIYLFLCAIPVIYLIHSWIKNKRSKITWQYAFIVFWLFLPIILVYWVSMHKPIFFPRYLIIVLPGFLLSAAFTLTRFKRKWMSITASVAMIICGISITMESYDDIKKPNWQGLVKIIHESSFNNDSFLFIQKASDIPFYYYWNRINIPPKNIIFGNPYKTYSRLSKPHPTKLDLQWIKNMSKRHKRIWLVMLWVEGTPHKKKFQGWLEKYYVKKQYWDFGQNLQLELYLNKNYSKMPPAQALNIK